MKKRKIRTKKPAKKNAWYLLLALPVILLALALKLFILPQISKSDVSKKIGLRILIPFGYKPKYYQEDIYAGDRLVIMKDSVNMVKDGTHGYDYPENQFIVIYRYPMNNIYTRKSMGDFSTAREFLSAQDKIIRNPPDNVLPITGYGMEIIDDVSKTFSFTKDIVMINRPFCLDGVYGIAKPTVHCLLFLTLGKNIKGAPSNNRNVYEILVVFSPDEKNKISFENTAFSIVNSIRATP